MRKAIVALMALTMAAALTACSGSAQTQSSTAQTQAAAGETETTAEAETAAEAETTSKTETATEAETNAADADAAAEAGTTAEENAQTAETAEDAAAENTSESGSNVLVAYFSATNTTEGVAEEIAGSLGADLYEIVSAEPYTDADLNYNDDNSRSTIEMNDPSSRPEISGSVENMEQYDIVFIGYPIWWGEAPRIVSTFMESYDFAGKTIIPFCTSGGSGVGSSASNLEELTEGATWLSGTRLSGSASHEDIVEWVNGLGLGITAE
ncbi:MAG: flavodoxin [Eubacteriales bacterium]|nr:flavodoxin [Eubacteriales bacterium]